MPIEEQIERAKALVSNKLKNKADIRYIAYFQSFTSTYIPLTKLREALKRAAEREEVAVVSVATRADCLPYDVLELLSEINAIKPVWVELGLQTSNEKTAALINRCCPLECFESAVKMMKSRGLEIIVHIILGLPGETLDDMLATVDYVNRLGVDGIKLQLLHVLKGTRLAEMDYTPMTLDAYTDVLTACVEHLSPDIVIHRLTGDGLKKHLIAPLWSGDKKTVLNAIHRKMRGMNSYQGKSFKRFSVDDRDVMC